MASLLLLTNPHFACLLMFGGQPPLHRVETVLYFLLFLVTHPMELHETFKVCKVLMFYFSRTINLLDNFTTN